VLEAAALQVGLEFPMDMVGQGFTLLGQLLDQGGSAFRRAGRAVSARADGVRIEFFVTAAFSVRKVDPLYAATAEKWQGDPTLCKRMG
jgi:hypothetical protein